MQVHRTPTLLLTRPRPASERFARGLEGADIIIAPLMEIVGTGAEIDLAGVHGLILTSQAAVPFVPQTTLPAYCVGARTTAVARGAGISADFVGEDADALVQALAARRPDGPLLHLHGTHTRGDIARRLSAHGITVQSLTLYDQRDCPPDPAFYDAITRPDLIVPLFSPRSAILFAAASQTLRDDTVLLALSPAVAHALPPRMQTQTRVAAAPTGQQMRDLLEPLGVQRNSP
ncbi:uroporphyrinogen-III synthase [Jannaschia sp. CCS1]|uniref:uroporphyrinogen-III synthase n=1 Tax=Jannaschia sp. (strain CCS1) TaxID=290400 RepID=UPI0001610905|nr:uroporphyrinogen-III synthase [Jannaschia sp. CCS1]